jgi:DNA-binding CsgD family transcriptional regulator
MASEPTPPLGFLPTLDAEDSTSLLEVIERLYSAVGDDTALSAAVVALSERFRASAVALHTYDHVAKRGFGVGLKGVDDAFWRAYEEYYSATNVWMLHGRQHMRPRHITVSHIMYPDELLERSEWYRDFLQPNGVYHSLGSVLQGDGPVTRTLIFLRPQREGRYNDAEMRLMRMLGPHLETAFRLQGRLVDSEARLVAGRTLLERTQCAVFLVARDGSVEASNTSARAIVEERDGLAVEGDRLVATDLAGARRLRSALEEAVAGAPKRAVGTASTLCVGRPSGRRPYQVWVTPCRGGSFRCAEPRVAAVVFVTDPESKAAADPCALIATYGLSPTEARVAGLLASGLDPAAISSLMGVSITTTRTHLARVRHKTHTHRQSELVALLLRTLRDQPA